MPGGTEALAAGICRKTYAGNFFRTGFPCPLSKGWDLKAEQFLALGNPDVHGQQACLLSLRFWGRLDEKKLKYAKVKCGIRSGDDFSIISSCVSLFHSKVRLPGEPTIKAKPARQLGQDRGIYDTKKEIENLARRVRTTAFAPHVLGVPPPPSTALWHTRPSSLG
jgi:hypothetical protein